MCKTNVQEVKFYGISKGQASVEKGKLVLDSDMVLLAHIDF